MVYYNNHKIYFRNSLASAFVVAQVKENPGVHKTTKEKGYDRYESCYFQDL